MRRATRSRHTSVRLPSHTLSDLEVVAKTVNTRSCSNDFSDFVSSAMKLPRLRSPATIARSGKAKERGRASEHKAPLEDTRRVSMESPDDPEHPTPEDRPCLPPTLEPLTRPARQYHIASELASRDGPAVLVPQEDAARDRTKACPLYSNALRTMLSQQQYVDVYFVASSLLTDGNTPATVEAGERERRLHLLSYRCLCSYALFRFKECCEDGTAALALYQQLRSHDGSSSPDSPEGLLHSCVTQLVVAALVMRELYNDAAELMESLPLLADINTEPLSKSLFDIPSPPLLAIKQRVLLSLASFRRCVEARRWEDAVKIIDGCALAQSWVQTTPLCAILAFARLELDDPKAARALLLPYLASLPEPPSWETLSTGPAEYAQLWGDFGSHFVFTMTLLAKASFMCGSAYLNISASLLQRVLKINPAYAPARLFAEFVLSYDTQQQRMATAVSASNYPAVLSVTSEMLRIPDTKRHVHAELYLVRAQVQWMQRQPLDVVREASHCVECDPECALALRLRADAFVTMGREAEAAADHAAAKHLHAKVDAVFEEMRVQRSRHEAAQAEARAKRQSIPVFAPFPSVAAPFHSSPMGRCRRGAWRRTDTGGWKGTDTNLSTSNRTYYSMLGVAREATAAEIRQNYRRLILQCHPDRLVRATESDRQAALEVFHMLSHAYSILSDTQLRATYDAGLSSLR
ncbi:hypothetical protein JKF63_01952 [Porcisia hertigi]|uniref:J domain-containing protein n=1 Tax=Porcisia hertigi TaxID=2761500 RepID=A0A836HX55_9TRYP|nr:hypothetical protein JKF63_01952 [Porcisia hertigi]